MVGGTFALVRDESVCDAIDGFTTSGSSNVSEVELDCISMMDVLPYPDDDIFGDIIVHEVGDSGGDAAAHCTEDTSDNTESDSVDSSGEDDAAAVESENIPVPEADTGPNSHCVHIHQKREARLFLYLDDRFDKIEKMIERLHPDYESEYTPSEVPTCEGCWNWDNYVARHPSFLELPALNNSSSDEDEDKKVENNDGEKEDGGDAKADSNLKAKVVSAENDASATTTKTAYESPEAELLDLRHRIAALEEVANIVIDPKNVAARKKELDGYSSLDQRINACWNEIERESKAMWDTDLMFSKFQKKVDDRLNALERQKKVETEMLGKEMGMLMEFVLSRQSPEELLASSDNQPLILSLCIRAAERLQNTKEGKEAHDRVTAILAAFGKVKAGQVYRRIGKSKGLVEPSFSMLTWSSFMEKGMYDRPLPEDRDGSIFY